MTHPLPDNASPRFVIIGIGNEFRGDDAVGIAVARQLGNMHLPMCTIIEERGDGAELLDRWNQNDYVILIDATVSGSTPGSVTKIDLLNQNIVPETFRLSSHSLGLAAAIELARTLRQLPSHAILYGIEGASFEPGVGMTRLVAKSVDAVANQIIREVSLN